MGLEVLPSQIRLQPRREDGYRWSVDPAKRHLFQRALSKLSSGVYAELLSGIGEFFHAIPASFENAQSSSDAVLSSGLHELQAQNETLQEKLDYWKTFAESEGRARLSAETRLKCAEQTVQAVVLRQKRMQASLIKIVEVVKENIRQE